MPRSNTTIDVYLEIGSKRTFAGVVEWPGWCRSGRDEQAALQALVDYARRYGRVAHAAGLRFQAPADTSFIFIKSGLISELSPRASSLFMRYKISACQKAISC